MNLLSARAISLCSSQACSALPLQQKHWKELWNLEKEWEKVQLTGLCCISVPLSWVTGREVPSCAIPFSAVRLLNNDFAAAKLVTGSLPEDGWNKINNRNRSTYK